MRHHDVFIPRTAISTPSVISVSFSTTTSAISTITSQSPTIATPISSVVSTVTSMLSAAYSSTRETSILNSGTIVYTPTTSFSFSEVATSSVVFITKEFTPSSSGSSLTSATLKASTVTSAPAVTTTLSVYNLTSGTSTSSITSTLTI